MISPDSLWQIIEHHPGKTQAQLSRMLQVRRYVICRKIVQMEKRGYLLYEDQGRLYPANIISERRIMTVADYLVKGLKLPPLEAPPIRLDSWKHDHHCAITGEKITFGYPVEKIIPDAAGEFLDMLPGGSKYLSENSARAMKGTWNLGSRIIFEDGTHFHPLIARDPKQERPCWSDLTRSLWQERGGESVLMILTTDVKKRIWHRARVGTLGTATPVFIYDVSDSGLSTLQNINWPVLLEILDYIENIYTMGFSKNGIRYSLLREWSRVQLYGTRQVIDLENQLKPLRERTEFAMAVIIAQKKEEKENESKTEQPKLF